MRTLQASPLSAKAAEMRSHLEARLIADTKNPGIFKLAKLSKARESAKTHPVPSGAREAWAANTLEGKHKTAGIPVFTHSAKGLHSAAQGSNVLCDVTSLPRAGAIGSHILADSVDWSYDAGGAAATAGLAAYLSTPLSAGDRRTPAALARDGDADYERALSDDTDRASALATLLARVSLPTDKLALDFANKQVLWFDTARGVPAADDNAYRNLVILFPASLVHTTWQLLRAVDNWRFDPARDAELPVIRYRMATTIAGGANSINVSILNNVRGGQCPALLSLPPDSWASSRAGNVAHKRCAVEPFFRQKAARDQMDEVTVRIKRANAEGPSNLYVQQRLDKALDVLVTQFLDYVYDIRSGDLSRFGTAEVSLPAYQQLWLAGPRTDAAPSADTDCIAAAGQMTERFARVVGEEVRKRDEKAGEGLFARVIEAVGDVFALHAALEESLN